MKNMVSITKTQFVAEWLERWTSKNEHMMSKDGSSNPTLSKCTLGVQVFTQCALITKCSCSTLMIKGTLMTECTILHLTYTKLPNLHNLDTLQIHLRYTKSTLEEHLRATGYIVSA